MNLVYLPEGRQSRVVVVLPGVFAGNKPLIVQPVVRSVITPHTQIDSFMYTQWK